MRPHSDIRSLGPRYEDIPQGQCRRVSALAVRDHSALVGIFLCITRCAAASLGGVSCGVQDRVRERQERFFAANQCRRVCNDWPLVAALLLVLSLIVVGETVKRRRSSEVAYRLPDQ